MAINIRDILIRECEIPDIEKLPGIEVSPPVSCDSVRTNQAFVD